MAHQSYLLLGEGDFTYSLDACRRLASLPVDGAAAAAAPAASSPLPPPDDVDVPATASVTCSGVDTPEELRGKYKDADFVLRGIRACHRSSQADGIKRVEMDVRIVHGINAVDAECNEGDAINEQFDRVIFNHPHLGTENAQLHSRFLCHLFHAAAKRWMKPRGLLHLTLVNGQCARWRCLEGAAKHGLQLLRRRAFRSPPPPVGEGGETYYELRRHQSGRSFAGRRRMQGGDSFDREGDSETLVFGREEYYSRSTSDSGQGADKVGLLPWETANGKPATPCAPEEARAATSEVPTIDNDNPHACNYCSKAFTQHRSLKNHMLCSHPDCDEVQIWKLEKIKKKKRKRSEGAQQSTAEDHNAPTEENAACPPWICTICVQQQTASHQVAPPAPRTFPHRQALLDHQRSKHHGAHLNIKPAWYRGGENGISGGEKRPLIGNCPICDAQYATEEDKLRHENEFIPSSSLVSDKATSDGDKELFKCCHCSKAFRELRARLQHENFCSRRKIIDSDGLTI